MRNFDCPVGRQCGRVWKWDWGYASVGAGAGPGAGTSSWAVSGVKTTVNNNNTGENREGAESRRQRAVY